MRQEEVLKILGRAGIVNPRIFILLASLTLILFYAVPAFAQSDQAKDDFEFTVVAGEELKKNPTAIKILQNIEIAKKRFAEMQNAEKQKTEHEKFIEEQRRIAKEQLEKDLASMTKTYENFTPKNSYARFVTGINASHHAIFWDQFDYMNEKVKIATQAKKAILDNGSTYAQAHAEFVKHASISRVNMINYVTELNIKHGFADESLQSYFDEEGKLPRYENDEGAPCYGCEKYEKIKEEILAERKRYSAMQNVLIDTNTFFSESGIEPQSLPQNMPQSETSESSVNPAISTDKNAYEISRYESTFVTISGKIENYQRGVPVVLTVNKLDGTQEELRIMAKGTGEYATKIMLGKDSPTGTYNIDAKYNNIEIGTVSFNVIEKS